MRQNYVICSDSCGTHRMSYTQWGNPDNPNVLLCVHGLTRTGRDFDFLARELAQDYCVICPDIVGRGESDWLPNAADYNLIVYVADILTLLKQLNLTQVDWIGTSMGGLIGILLASDPRGIIRRLVLNDVGAYIPKDAIQRIAGYLLKETPIFPDFAAAQNYVRSIYQGFGSLTEKQWQHLTKYSIKSLPDGGYCLNYDPQISFPFQKIPIDLIKSQDFYIYWRSIFCPVLLLHGQNSDLLLFDTIEEMKKIKPSLDIVSFPDLGHAPALMSQEQISTVKNWLLSSPNT